MGARSNGGLAVLALGVLSLMPAAASAGSLFGYPSDPGPRYSPWHYRTPILYRLCEEHYYGLGLGSYRPSRYPAVPVAPYPSPPASPGDQPGGTGAIPPAGSPEASGPQPGP
jgi:hypothetical protein